MLTLPELRSSSPSKRSLRKRRNVRAHTLNGNVRKGVLSTHWNAGSARLENKIQHLELYVKEHKPSLFGVSEANLTCDSSLAETSITGYDMLTTKAYSDLDQLNSRLVLYVADTLTYSVREDLMSDSCSSIWVQVTTKGGKRCLFGFAYREFQIWGKGAETRSDQAQVRRWVTLTNQVKRAMTEGTDCIFQGDLNIDFNVWGDSLHLAGRLVDIFETEVTPHGAVQLVEVNTRTRTGGMGTILDHVWVNCADKTNNVTVGAQAHSDHKPTSIVYGSCSNTLGETMVNKREMSGFDSKEYCVKLAEANLSSVLDITDVDLAVKRFTDIVCGVLDTMAPKKLIQVRKNFAPWVKKETLLLMRSRDLAAKEKDTGGDIEAEAFRKLRNEVNRKIAKDKKDWTEKILKACEEDKSGGLLWKYAKNRMSQTKSGPPKSLQYKGRLLHRPREVAAAQAEFYSEKILKINRDLDEARATSGDPLLILKESLADWDRWSEDRPSFSLQPITIADTRRLLKDTSSSSTEGFDDISSNAVKAGGELMLLVVRHLINLSLVSGHFPEDWKQTKIKPLYKGKGQTTSPGSFRPIAILSATSKVLEKAVTEQVTGYFVKNRLLNENHHAYQARKSTATALQHLTDNLAEMLERGETGIAVILDMSAAFDSVNVVLLCQKLTLYGLDDTAVGWMRSYLERRRFAVEIGGVTGDLRESSSGVPQGSVLGPVLFTVFTNELPSVIQSVCETCSLEPRRGRCGLFKMGCDLCGSTTAYADDVTHVFGEHDMTRGKVKMKGVVTSFTDFLTSNSLKINDDKTHTLKIMTRQRRAFAAEDDLDAVFGGKLVKPTRKEKLLGCWLHHGLSWRSHILEGPESIRGKMTRKLGELWRLGPHLKTSSRLKLANGCIMSILRYAAPVWGGESETTLDILQKLLNKTARWCLGTGRRTRVTTLMLQCGWLSVRQMVAYTSLISLWKTVYTDPSSYWKTRILRQGDGRALRSTSGGSLVPHPLPWLNITRSTWRWRSIRMWNCLPPALRQETDSRNFAKFLKSWVKDNVRTQMR